MKRIWNIALAFVLMFTLVACNTSTKEEASKETNDEVTIYLVRHGKTWFNTTGQVQGFADSPLTEKGVEQAKQVGVGLKDITFDAAYSSSLGRQRETAQHILDGNKNDIPTIIELDGFKEWNYGGFEGRDNEAMWRPILEQYNLQWDDNWTDYPKIS